MRQRKTGQRAGQRERGDCTEGTERMTIPSKGSVRVEIKVLLFKDKRETSLDGQRREIIRKVNP